MAYVVKFDSDTEGNWCSQCAGVEYPTREAAQAAIDADETARPDAYGNTVDVWIEEMADADDCLSDAASNVSDELDAGLVAWRAKIAPLIGKVVSVTMPNGVTVTGTFSDSPHGECQPTVTRDDGKRYRVPGSEVDRLAADVDAS